jgi:hypothetical protein
VKVARNIQQSLLAVPRILLCAASTLSRELLYRRERGRERDTTTLEISFAGMCIENPRELSRVIKYIGNRGQQDFGSIQIKLNFRVWPLQVFAIFMFHIMPSA